MHRLFIFVSLIVILVALVLRKLNADRVLHRARRARLGVTAGEVARKMLDSARHPEVEVKVTTRATRVWAGAETVGNHWLKLPTETAKNHSAYAHGHAALSVGLYLLSLQDPKAMDRRRWALRFGHVFPIFTVMVLAFALFVRMPMGWVFAGVLSSLALATCAQILTLKVERQAADLACIVIEKKRTYPRLSDEESVVAATRAWSWWGLLPGILARLG